MNTDVTTGLVSDGRVYALGMNYSTVPLSPRFFPYTFPVQFKEPGKEPKR